MQAAANAKNNLGLRKARLFVSKCFADGGPQLKRVRPRAKGRCDLLFVSRALALLPQRFRLCLLKDFARVKLICYRRGNKILKPMVHMTIMVQER